MYSRSVQAKKQLKLKLYFFKRDNRDCITHIYIERSHSHTTPPFHTLLSFFYLFSLFLTSYSTRPRAILFLYFLHLRATWPFSHFKPCFHKYIKCIIKFYIQLTNAYRKTSIAFSSYSRSIPSILS